MDRVSFYVHRSTHCDLNLDQSNFGLSPLVCPTEVLGGYRHFLGGYRVFEGKDALKNLFFIDFSLYGHSSAHSGQIHFWIVSPQFAQMICFNSTHRTSGTQSTESQEPCE